MKFVRELTQQGADLAHQDEWGNTALHYAVTNGAPAEYVNYLLSQNAPTNLANNEGQTPLFNVLSIPYSPLRYEIAKLLIEAGSPIAHKNNRGKSVLDLVQDAKLRELFANALRDRAQIKK